MEILLTTSELIDEAEKMIGTSAGMSSARINYTKLLRWQREGLLPKQRPSSAGPGERQESLWNGSCIGQLQVIAGCVKGERLNRTMAEQALIAAGYWIRGDLLKRHLVAACKKMSVELKKQQRNENPDPTDQAANLERSTSDRMSAHGELVKDIFAACRLGYMSLSEEAEYLKSFATIGSSYFQPNALYESIESKTPEELEFTYQNPLIISFAAFINSLFDLIYGKNKELPILGLDGNAIIAKVLNMLAPMQDGKLRRKKPYPYSTERARYNAHLTATILYLVYCQNQEKFPALILQAIGEIQINKEFVIPENIKDMLNSKLGEPNGLFNLPSMPK